MNRVAEHGGAPRALPEWTRPRRVSVTAFAAALTATLFAVTAPAEEHLLRGGNGPGPAANGPGPGCNLIPPLASTGTKMDISQFPPPGSSPDPELAGPDAAARPGSVGDADYSPLVRVDGIVYDAPIVAAAVEDADINFPSGKPDYALVHDQVIAIDPAHRTVTLSLINGFSFGKPVLYISTESSDPTVSAIEGNTFAPRMRKLEVGIDDISRSAVERIFIATNGASEGGCKNPQRQGLSAALLDGHRPNNTFGGVPTIAGDYSPVWDANLYEWTQDAIEKGYRGLLTEEFRILKLARDGYITGPNGAPFGSAGPVIVCGVAARLN